MQISAIDHPNEPKGCGSVSPTKMRVSYVKRENLLAKNARGPRLRVASSLSRFAHPQWIRVKRWH